MWLQKQGFLAIKLLKLKPWVNINPPCWTGSGSGDKSCDAQGVVRRWAWWLAAQSSWCKTKIWDLHINNCDECDCDLGANGGTPVIIVIIHFERWDFPPEKPTILGWPHGDGNPHLRKKHGEEIHGRIAKKYCQYMSICFNKKDETDWDFAPVTLPHNIEPYRTWRNYVGCHAKMQGGCFFTAGGSFCNRLWSYPRSWWTIPGLWCL